MSQAEPIILDARDTGQVLDDLLARAPGYLPAWAPAAEGPDAAVLNVTARFVGVLLERLNQAPLKSKLAFLDLLGIDAIPPSPARTAVAFTMHDESADARLPAGSRLAAPPPPGSSRQISFETERSTGLAVAQLKQVVSLWPGRDQYLDHTERFTSAQPFELFRKPLLVNTPHAIYIGHDVLLALAGKATLQVVFDVTTPADPALELTWEYWDGKVWRAFANATADCVGSRAAVTYDSTAGLTRSGRYTLTTDCAEAEPREVDGRKTFWVRGRLEATLPPDPSRVLPLVDQVMLVTSLSRMIGYSDAKLSSELDPVLPGTGLRPDQAFSDEASLDPANTFYPFGQQPQPGSTFYFLCDEVFTKPGASVEIAVRAAETPQRKGAPAVTEPPGDESIEVFAGRAVEPLAHTLEWSYWDGDGWVEMAIELSATKDLYEKGGTVRLQVPDDMRKTVVNDVEGFWVRVRLVSGGFGVVQTVKEGANNYRFAIYVPPAYSEFRIGYTWSRGPFPPKHVLAYNDFGYTDETDAAVWPGATFRPFTPISDATPALYLGFDKKLPVDQIGLLFDVAERPADTLGPALVWEYWNGFAWSRVAADDETRHLRVPGIVSFIAAGDMAALARFDASLYWVRARLNEDGPPGEPTIKAIYPNAVWATQQQTVVDDPLGSASGRSSESLVFRQVPVLPGQQVEVRELSGRRAETEWRILAAELFGQDGVVRRALERDLSSEGTQADVVAGPLRLRRDRHKRVTEAWVTWEEVPNFYGSGPQDRHYVMQHITGVFRSGDGRRGRAFPPGAPLQARLYRTGGGRAGNVAAGAIQQLLGAAAGVERAWNPLAAEGGADAEPAARVAARGPLTVRHRGRALLPEDYEVMAKEASAAVAVAHALPCRDPAGHPAPGWVTLVIIPAGEEQRPWPSYGLREAVRTHVNQRADATLAAGARIYVTGPHYTPVSVSATLAPHDPAEAGDVETRARAALAEFLHPLRGGTEGAGWTPGRSVHVSDVASALQRVAGVDYVQDLALIVDNIAQGGAVTIAPDRTAVAGDIRIRVVRA